MSLTLGIIASSRGNIVPPLDTYGGAAAAYSTRLLSSAYGGSAVRVRRSFDNAEQDIGFSGGAIDETALMNFVGYQNLFLQSETFETVSWIKLGTTAITANATTDPIGGNTAELATSTAGQELNVHQMINPVVAGQSYTNSIYVKKLTATVCTVYIFSQTTTSLIAASQLNFDTGVLTTSIGSGVVQNVGNGWYRVSVTAVTANAGSHTFGVYNPTGTVGAGNFYIWGAQLNAGTTAQPYQVTTSAARSGDGFVTKWYTQDSNGENLLTYSEQFENVAWNKTVGGANNSIISNSTTAPNGTLTADTLVFENGLQKWIGYDVPITLQAGQQYNFSIWVKRLSGTSQIRLNLDPYQLLPWVDINVTSEWTRVSITQTSVSTTSSPVICGILSANGSGDQIYIWGAQLSQGSWLQPYQATTTTAILRRDASQSTAANQPRIVGGGVIERENGKAAIRFNSNPKFLQIASNFSTFNNTSIFSVVKPDNYNAGAENARFYDLYDGLYHIQYLRDSASQLLHTKNTLWQSLNDSTQYTTKIAPTSQFLSSVISLSSSTDLYFNSYIQNKVSAANVGSAGAVSVIGQRSDILSTTNLFGGYQELLVYQSNRTSTRADIERNIGAYYQTHWTGASSGLLDQFGGAAAAYSLRNLSSSYRGPLIRVRRSSDNAETDIGGTYNGDLDVASLVSFTGGQNLLTYSEDFTQAAWIKVNSSITANATIAPDGTLTADKYTETAVNGQHALAQNYTIPASSSFTLSFYAKAAERSKIRVILYLNASPVDYYSSYFDLSNGTVYQNVTLAAGSFISSSIQPVGNGWYRCSITGNTNKTGNHQSQIDILNDLWQLSYLGVAGSGVYIWGAQLNTGILQPYIPTTTAAVNGANAFVTKWYTQDNNYQNLLLQSQTFENASWIKSNTSITQDSTAAPDGTLTADTLVENTALAGHQTSQALTTTANQTYTYSVYAKLASGSRYLGISPVNSTSSGNNQTAVFDLVNGVFLGNAIAPSPSIPTGSPFTSADVSIQSAGNGWWRCSVRVSVSGTSYGCTLRLYNAFSNGTSTGLEYTGDGTSGVFLWGAQLNEGSVAFPYTATTNTISQRRDAIQATAANQPRIVNAGGVESEGNRPALFFDGAGDFFSMPNIEVNNLDYSAFHVSRNNSNTTRGFELSSANVGPYFGKANDGNLYVQYIGATDLYYSAAEPSTVLSLRSGFARAASANAYINNLQLSLSAPVSYTASDTGFNQIGKYSSSPTSNAEASELVLYIGDRLSSRTGIESNINSYYQIYWQGNGTALLDSFSGASAAYSLRNLSSAYTGPLIRVRRSNDNVERDIYGTFGGDLDIASLVAFVGANSGFVTTWYDQSGNARHAAQTTAANQPRIVNAGVVETQNGKPAVYNLVGCGMSFSSISLTNFTILWVSVRDTTNANQSIMLSNSLATSTYIGDDVDNQGNPMAYSFGYIIALPRNNTSATNLETSYHLSYLNRRNSTEAVGEFNNSSNSYNNSVPSTTITINAIALYPTTAYNYVGKIQEIIVYSNDQSSSRTPISSNINNYYKIY